MDGAQKFWVTIWTLTTIVILSFMLALTVDSYNDNNKITELVAKGVPAIQAHCAIKGISMNTLIACTPK